MKFIDNMIKTTEGTTVLGLESIEIETRRMVVGFTFLFLLFIALSYVTSVLFGLFIAVGFGMAAVLFLVVHLRCKEMIKEREKNQVKE